MIDSINAAAIYGDARADAVIKSLNAATRYSDTQARLVIESQNAATRYSDSQEWLKYQSQIGTALGQYDLDQGTLDREYDIHRQLVQEFKDVTSALATIEGNVLSAQIAELTQAMADAGQAGLTPEEISAIFSGETYAPNSGQGVVPTGPAR